MSSLSRHYRPHYDEIGRKLRYHRRRRGISQSEIAEHLGMTRQRYSRIEQRPTKAPREIQEQINEYILRDGYKEARERKARSTRLDAMMAHPSSDRTPEEVWQGYLDATTERHDDEEV